MGVWNAIRKLVSVDCYQGGECRDGNALRGVGIRMLSERWGD